MEVRFRYPLFVCLLCFVLFFTLKYLSIENWIVTHNPVLVSQCAWNKRIRTRYSVNPTTRQKVALRNQIWVRRNYCPRFYEGHENQRFEQMAKWAVAQGNCINEELAGLVGR